MIGMAGMGPAVALEAGKDEKDNLRACERRVCDIMLKRSLKGDDVKCHIVKTWEKSTIKNGVEGKNKLSWSMGDARCEMDLSLSRGELVAAMSAPSHRFKFGEQTISCVIEQEKSLRNVRVVLAPEVEFDKGEAKRGKVHVKKVSAPFFIKTGIWTAATLIDTVGVFQRDLVKELNKLSRQRCPEQYGKPEGVAGKAAPKAKSTGVEAKPQKAEAGAKTVAPAAAGAAVEAVKAIPATASPQQAVKREAQAADKAPSPAASGSAGSPGRAEAAEVRKEGGNPSDTPTAPATPGKPAP
jgi:hypothetical protein